MLRSLSLLALASCALSARAGLFGSTVSLNYDYPAQGTSYADRGTAVVGAGVEYTSTHAGLYPGYADLTDTTVVFGQATDGVSFGSGPFNGFDLTVVTGAAITGASFVGGVAPTSFEVIGGHLYVNYLNQSFGTGETSTFSVTTASVAPSVPGPMAALPFALMAIKRRKRA